MHIRELYNEEILADALDRADWQHEERAASPESALR